MAGSIISAAKDRKKFAPQSRVRQWECCSSKLGQAVDRKKFHAARRKDGEDDVELKKKWRLPIEVLSGIEVRWTRYRPLQRDAPVTKRTAKQTDGNSSLNLSILTNEELGKESDQLRKLVAQSFAQSDYLQLLELPLEPGTAFASPMPICLEPGLVFVKNAVDRSMQQRLTQHGMARGGNVRSGFWKVQNGQRQLNYGSARGQLFDMIKQHPVWVQELGEWLLNLASSTDPTMGDMWAQTHVQLMYHLGSQCWDWHEDEAVNVEERSPTVLINLGSSCDFGIQHQGDGTGIVVTLESGDGVVVGGHCCMALQSVLKVHSGTTPEELKIVLPYGRLDVIFRATTRSEFRSEYTAVNPIVYSKSNAGKTAFKTPPPKEVHKHSISISIPDVVWGCRSSEGFAEEFSDMDASAGSQTSSFKY